MTTPSVARRDEGFGLRVLRAARVHPDALVIRSGTDVVVRTPTRPGRLDGNVVDLLVPPAAADVTGRIAGMRRLMEPAGVGHLHLRYELPPGTVDDADRVAALTDAGLTVAVLRVLSLAPSELPEVGVVPPAGVTVERLDDPDGDAIAARRWYAASVLDRYAHGEDVDAWRAWDAEEGAWERERIATLARLGRAEVWLASRMGMPVASVTLVDDHDGLVVVDHVVTHPAQRGSGIARVLATAALASLRSSAHVRRVATAVVPDGPGERLARELGALAVAEAHQWSRPAGWGEGRRR